jgi:hypothetical protein
MLVVLRQKPLPLAGCVNADVLAGFTLSPGTLVDRTPFSFSADEVERVVVSVGSQRLELVRDGEGFSLKAPVQTRVALAQGNQRIETLVGSAGQKVKAPDLAALGLEPPSGSMVITGLSEVTNSTVDERILLGATDSDGRLPIRRQADGNVFLIPEAEARAFRVDATLSRSLKLFDFSEDSLSEMHVVSDQLTQKIERQQGEYRLTQAIRTTQTLVWCSQSCESNSAARQSPAASTSLLLWATLSPGVPMRR